MKNLSKKQTLFPIILLSIILHCTSNSLAIQPNFTADTPNKPAEIIYFNNTCYTIDPAKKTEVTKTIEDIKTSSLKKSIAFTLSALSGTIMGSLICYFSCNSDDQKDKIAQGSMILSGLGLVGLKEYYVHYQNNNVHEYLQQKQREYRA